MRELGMVACCWQWDKRRKQWLLKHTVCIDDDGHPMTGSSPEWVGERPVPWEPWLNSARPDEDGYVEGWKPIRGRAVTGWTPLGGVILLGVCLSDRPSRGLADSFESELTKADNWSSLIERGYLLRLGTAEAVQDLLLPKQGA